jgi:hypothetical protein
MASIDCEWDRLDDGKVKRIDYEGGGVTIEDMGGDVFKIDGLYKARGRWREYSIMMGLSQVRQMMRNGNAPAEMIP